MMVNSQQVIRRLSDFKSKRGTWESHWQEIADLMFPNHPTFIGDESAGTKKGLKMYDGTAVHASEMLAAGFHGFLTNPASEWFTLSLANKKLNNNKSVKIWLSQVQDIMYDEISNAKTAFSTHIHEMYLEFGVFGTGVLFTGENDTRDGLLFKAIPLSSCYIAENKDGIVDTVYRTIPFTVRQVFETWGTDASEQVQKKFKEKKFDEIIEVVHATEPAYDNPNFVYSSTYVEVGQKHKLSESGYKTFPYSIPRFYKAAGEVYGRGPGVTALPDVKMLNQMMHTTIKAAQKIVDPPLQMPDTGYLGPVRTIPGGVNYFKGGTKDRIEPLMTNANIPVSLELMNEIRMRIQRVFFVDLLELPHKVEHVTATEIMQRTEDRLRVMGPILGRMQAEALNTIILRAFSVLSNLGMFPEMPMDLTQEELVIEYVSPIARAQKQMEAGGLQRVLEVMTPFISADPTLLGRFDAGEILEATAEMFGLRPSFIKDEEQFNEEVNEKNQMAQLGQAAEVAKTGSEAGLNIQQLVANQ